MAVQGHPIAGLFLQKLPRALVRGHGVTRGSARFTTENVFLDSRAKALLSGLFSTQHTEHRVYLSSPIVRPTEREKKTTVSYLPSRQVNKFQISKYPPPRPDFRCVIFSPCGDFSNEDVPHMLSGGKLKSLRTPFARHRSKRLSSWCRLCM